MTAETGVSPTSIINLSKANVLLIDDSPFGLRLLDQMMKGFGVRACYACSSSIYAQDVIRRESVDLIVIDCDMPEFDGYDLIRWMRNSGLDNAYTPVIMVAGHTKASKVKKARDCGANFIIARPFSPSVLLDRIVWTARDPRPFLEAADYAGPDRRFHDEGPPRGVGERRADRIREAEAKAAAAQDVAVNEAKGDPI